MEPDHFLRVIQTGLRFPLVYFVTNLWTMLYLPPCLTLKVSHSNPTQVLLFEKSYNQSVGSNQNLDWPFGIAHTFAGSQDFDHPSRYEVGGIEYDIGQSVTCGSANLQVFKSTNASKSPIRKDFDSCDPSFEWENENIDLNQLEEDMAPEYVAEVAGGPLVAAQLSRQLGFHSFRPVRGFKNLYVFVAEDEPVPNGNATLSRSHRRLRRDVLRQKRDALTQTTQVSWVSHQRALHRVKRAFVRAFNTRQNDLNDPLWKDQWPLHDRTSAFPKFDLNVIGAWRKGYTGKGISVTILDDGIQRTHPDLAQNYDPLASYDLNDNDHDPSPTLNEFNKHGTRCAGQVAMVANNDICGVGVAYDAKIGGIRMLDGRITDRLESEALQFNIHHVDVFSASWGPNDDGKTVEGPGRLASQAIKNGIQRGRNGKGVIYVWASGNGGIHGDNCNCDGYTDSIYTLSISSASRRGDFPWYGEQCASTITTTYSSGNPGDQKIATTDIRGGCTRRHSGTSASAPFAAGIVALGLEANSQLTWRDVQHIAVWTGEPGPLLDNVGWTRNGRGLLVNERFGFGLMNAESFVSEAESWTLVPEQKICKTVFPQFIPRSFGSGKPGIIRFKTNACEGKRNHVRFLEHVQIVVDLDYSRRGNLEIFLISPSGTTAQLLTSRKRDNSRLGFRDWPFMSVHSWGENPAGWWELQIFDNNSRTRADFGQVNSISLITYGTEDQPQHYNEKRDYNKDYNQNAFRRSTGRRRQF